MLFSIRSTSATRPTDGREGVRTEQTDKGFIRKVRKMRREYGQPSVAGMSMPIGNKEQSPLCRLFRILHKGDCTPQALWRLFHDGHFVNQVAATAKLVDDEEHIAYIYRNTTLEVVVEVDVTAQ